MNSPDLAEVIAAITRDFKEPAGSGFPSLEAIHADYITFLHKTHETWKRLHEQALDELLTFDAISQCERDRPIKHGVSQWAEYTRALWRRVNDSIIWSLCGLERHTVKRLCLYRPRGYLLEANAATTLSIVREINADPLQLAIWNDATTCVDVGDITCVDRRNGRPPDLEFLEVKGGSVNRAVVDLLGLAEGPEFEIRHSEFVAQYGKKGVQQLERFKRQAKRNDQAIALLTNERGVDPVTGELVEVVDTRTEFKSYDVDLDQMLGNVLAGAEEAWHVVDGCLWVYASTNKERADERFRDVLTKHGIQLGEDQGNRVDFGRIASLHEGFGVPLARPLYLRRLKAEIIGEIAYGRLLFRVLMYIDWPRFLALFEDRGATIKWLSGKAARRLSATDPRMRPAIVGGRYPEIKLGAARTFVTTPNIVQILFDGITPKSIVEAQVKLWSTRQEAASGRDQSIQE
jgi:hypothetical protein